MKNMIWVVWGVIAGIFSHEKHEKAQKNRFSEFFLGGTLSPASTADGLVSAWRGLPSPRSLLRGGTRAGSPCYMGSLKYRTDPFSSISSPLSSPGFLLG